MLRPAALPVLLTALVFVPVAAHGDSFALKEKRNNSCGTKAFGEVPPDSYRNLRHNVVGKTYVGDAVLEWCQHAQNAVIYFYVDDPSAPTHSKCPENMSIAVFANRGDETEKIIRDNEPSYYMPGVKLIEKPVISEVKIERPGRTIDAFQLEAVMVDVTGHNRRQKMIGYKNGPDFIRVMTGVIDDGTCANGATRSFMTKLDWP